MSISVDIEWKEDEKGFDEAVFFVADDGTMKWPCDKVRAFDWKDDQGPGELKDTVILFDGTDSIIYASMNDAIKI